MYKKLFLLIILLLAGFLRFIQIDKIPPSLTWDEAAWGYNAYSLGIDLKDEFGRFLPITYLESFGDFKPPLYAYSAILPIKIFGLNEFAARFSSAFFGTLTILITYFLVKEIFGNKNKKDNKDSIELIALLSAFILAVSPWHIMLSRAAFEANVATFFLVTGVWLYLRAINSNRWLLILSAISFVLSMYTFNTTRVVAPLLVIGFLAAYFKDLWRYKKQTLIAGFLGTLLILPAVPFLLSPQASLRFREVNIFSDLSVIQRTNQQIEIDNNAWWSRIIHNRRIAYGVEFIRHYIDNLTPSFLFIKGDGNPKFSTQMVGQLYILDIPFLVAGILFLFRKREGSWWVIPYWLFIGIIPAATARETPHALRIEATLPTFQILVAYGAFNVANVIKNKTLKVQEYKKVLRKNFNISIKALPIIFFILYTFSVAYFLHGYFNHYPYEYSGEWQYGYKQSIDYVKQTQNQYSKIYITTDLGRPYIYYLFYLKTVPDIFRSTADVHRDAFGFVDVKQFDKYVFTSNMPENVPQGENYLFVNVSNKVPSNANILKRIELLNNQPVLTIYTI